MNDLPVWNENKLMVHLSMRMFSINYIRGNESNFCLSSLIVILPVSAAASKISCCGQLQISTQEDDRKQGKCNCIYHFVSGEFHLSPFFTSDKIICNSPLSAGAQKDYKGTRLFNLTIQTIFQA